MKGMGWLAAVLMAALVMPTVATAAGGNHTEMQTARKVREKVQEKASLKKVDVALDDGIATLTGEVDLLVHLGEAEKRARRVAGVSGVRNQIRVVPATPVSDAALQETLATRLAYDRSGFHNNVFNTLWLKVENGLVTLGGKVRDHVDRDSALAMVQTTPGVTGMLDDVEVAPASFLDDELRIRTAQAIYGHATFLRYAMDPAKPIRIVVDSGHVELHGMVANALDKQVALAQARSVPGAFSVTDRLTVATDTLR